MNKNKNELKEKELEAATGGVAPELPTPSLDPKEIHIYKNELADPEQFTAKMGEGKEPSSFKVGFFPGLSGFP